MSIEPPAALRGARGRSIGQIGAMVAFSRYVALGDSFTEGCGDPSSGRPNGLRGWADRVAEVLAQSNPEMRYVNLAVRGRTMDEILAEQLQTAVMLEPDIVTIHAGMNDLLLVRHDIDAMMARYADALKTLQQSGAVVLTFTAADLGTVPLFRRLRGRTAIYNELLRTTVDDLGVQLVDFWRFSEFRDPRLWDGDRIHLSPMGHERMAAKVLDTLTVPHNLTSRSAALLASTPPARSFWGDLRWAAAFAAPWVGRRLRRVTPGAGVTPKSTTLTQVLQPVG
ncbi:lysophospholipase L1-like esterase [Mycolicibacterium rhodesiae NBB3]|uniref:Lysophospholipase L1-like esterase n=2 Tax=Mycolicibacterium rhodesiae TaxID=36814 RepID=G8RT05_MYCRN|nr:lysophospholipase L1-like esterase [Mycolicibacterium rhodesiae NBB3]